MEIPETQYVDSGGIKIASQVFGEGEHELVIVPGFVSNLDLQWSDPAMAAFNERLGSFARVVMYDKAGTGLSDPLPAVPTLEQRMADLRAVLDVAEVERPTLLGISEGGPLSLLYAATYPERVRGLMLYGSFSSGASDPDNPGGARWLDLIARMRIAVDNWGEGLLTNVFGPTLAGQPLTRRFAAAHERAMASPAMARATYDAVIRTDVREILPTIGVPTLILHRIGDAMPIEGARDMADRIPDANLVELPGADHFWFVGETEPLLGAIEEFVTGTRPPAARDRMLATVLFTDIVGSTARASELGDTEWRHLLEAHNRLTRERLTTFGGLEVASTGDGFLATFDGPARALRCAHAVANSVREIGLEIRAGVHTGECERLDDGIAGIAVHVGARVAATAGPGEVLASATVRNLVGGSGIEFEDAGEHELKGVPGTWRLSRVTTVPAAASQGDREPIPQDVTPLVHERAPLSQRALVAAMQRAPRLSRRIGDRVYARATRAQQPAG